MKHSLFSQILRQSSRIALPDQLASIAARLLRRHEADHDLDRRARRVVLRSAALGIRKPFYVYTPPHSNRGSRLPVLYLFRGHEHEWINRTQDASRNGRTVIDVYEELLRAGSVGPMALVFPGISSDDNSVPGLLVNFKQPQATDKAGIGRGRFEDYFIQELMPYVDQHFNTDPGARAVHGFSLGGFMAVKIAMQYPDLFSMAGAYDGLYFWDDPHDAHSIADDDHTFNNPMFDPAFGARRDRRYAAANNPMNLARNGATERLAQVQWLIEYGPRASEPGDSNFKRGDRLVRLLHRQGIKNAGRGEVLEGTHSWRFADEHMRHCLPLYWRALRPEQA